MVNRLLTVDPKRRITVEEALEHSWIKEGLSPNHSETSEDSNSVGENNNSENNNNNNNNNYTTTPKKQLHSVKDNMKKHKSHKVSNSQFIRHPSAI